MKQTILSLLALFLGSIAFAQSAVDEQLLAQLSQLPAGETVDVLVFRNDRPDFVALRSQFDAAQTPVPDRAREVLAQLDAKSKDNARFISDLVAAYNLNHPTASVELLQQFLVVNVALVRADAGFIMDLALQPGVEFICSQHRFGIQGVQVFSKQESVNRSVGSHEIGLEAIAAPFMWNLGYTGLGRKLYTVDTGVWTVHPALKDQWLGNHLPLSQVWFGFDAETPADKPDAHGTHVTGTVLGLDRSQADTIGVAFEAMYMSSDPIVEDPADIKPLTAILQAFDFALNPDADLLTVDDMPDVICNSWGIGDSIAEGLCTAPFVVDLFASLDLAGIAVEFSAGNEGPNPGTIGLPQYVTIDTLSIFTVGALDAANVNLSIASFSSRGPTSCDVPDAWKIKPEVSAPGVNVRSSVQFDQYAEYSGTSMAGPHVSGAILLLKEAFPYLSGRDILNALYQSAIDLGEVGEDNTYGKGMINLEAAYQFLSLTNTPVPPNTSSYDLRLTKILMNDVVCRGNQTVEVEINNAGSLVLGGAILNILVDGAEVGSYSWTGLLIPGASEQVSLGTVNLTPGDHEIIVQMNLTSNVIERSVLNNSWVKRVHVQLQDILPYAESFESNDLSDNGIYVRNPDFSKTWDTTHTSGLNNSNFSARMQFLSYSRKGQWDEFYLPSLSIPNGADSVMLRFDYAYRFRTASLADTLEVGFSSDCGQTWTPAFRAGGEELSTIDTLWTNFRPFSPSHWQTFRMNLLPQLEGDQLMVRFSAYNRSGSNLYVDNIGIYTTTDPTGIEFTSVQALSVYPNPSQDRVNFNFMSGTDGHYSVYDLLGKKQLQGNLLAGVKQQSISVENLPAGIYILRVQSDGLEAASRMVVTK